MEAPQLLKSRNKGSIQVRDEAAVRFVNADPTGALCHVGSRDLGLPGPRWLIRGMGRRGRGWTASRAFPGPRCPLRTSPCFSSSLTLCLQDQTHVAARTPPPSSSAGGKGTAVITHGIAACQALPGALHVLTLHPPATASAGS